LSWFRHAETAAEPAVEAAPSAPPAPAEHPSPGLKLALETYARRGASVLELGPLLAANLAVFCELGVRLRVVDLESSLAEAGMAEPPTGAAWERALPELVPFAADERFDLILAWDLPNHLGRERWQPLAARLAAQLAPGGALHLLVRIDKEMPARPSHYRIVEPGILSEERRTSGLVPAPRFSHAEVEKLTPGLAAAKSFLGKHGVQEFLLEHSEELHLPPRRVAQARKRPPSAAIRIPPEARPKPRSGRGS
jgi:hypothetical protein